VVDDLAKAERMWDGFDVEAGRSVSWLALRTVDDDARRGLSPDPSSVSWVAQLLRERGSTDGLVGAALVCGDMQSERPFFEHPTQVSFAEVHGYDLSQESLNKYVPDGVSWHPHKVDCNVLDLPEKAFDLIVVSHGAHHVMRIDRFFEQARQALRPAGLIYIYEWIGPKYLRVPRKNRLVATLLLLVLFPGRRTRRTHLNKVKGLRWIMDPADPNLDPSEACNSLQLHRAFTDSFSPLSQYFHGALTYPMFEGIGQNLDESKSSVRRRIRWVLAVEKFLIARRLVHPLFVVAVAEPRVRK
jgi:SAM-dependent methyltransferase